MPGDTMLPVDEIPDFHEFLQRDANFYIGSRFLVPSTASNFSAIYQNIYFEIFELMYIEVYFYCWEVKEES